MHRPQLLALALMLAHSILAPGVASADPYSALLEKAASPLFEFALRATPEGREIFERVMGREIDPHRYLEEKSAFVAELTSREDLADFAELPE